MKVTHNSPDRLAISAAPWGTGLTFIAIELAVIWYAMHLHGRGDGATGILIVTGVTALLGLLTILFIKRNDLVFDRGAGVVVHRCRSVFHSTVTEHKIADVLGAHVHIRTDPESGPLHKVTLIMKDEGEHLYHFTEAYSTKSSTETVVNTINTWLRDIDSQAARA